MKIQSPFPYHTLAPNGVIYVDNANVYLSGTLSGKVTVVCRWKLGTEDQEMFILKEI